MKRKGTNYPIRTLSSEYSQSGLPAGTFRNALRSCLGRNSIARETPKHLIFECLPLVSR